MKIDRLIRYAAATFLWVFLCMDATSRDAIHPKPLRPVNMVASFYGAEFEGKTTASGATFNPAALTAAHRTLPFGTRLRLTNPKTRKSITVRVNDRGPYNEFAGIQYFYGTRDLDVSQAAAHALGFEREGIATLMVQLAPPASH